MDQRFEGGLRFRKTTAEQACRGSHNSHKARPELAYRYRVSEEAMSFRLLNLGLG